MKRSTIRAIRNRYLEAVRKGHYSKAVYIKRYLKTVQALTREVRNGA